MVKYGKIVHFNHFQIKTSSQPWCNEHLFHSAIFDVMCTICIIQQKLNNSSFLATGSKMVLKLFPYTQSHRRASLISKELQGPPEPSSPGVDECRQKETMVVGARSANSGGAGRIGSPASRPAWRPEPFRWPL